MAVGDLSPYYYNYYDIPYIGETLECTDADHDHTYYYPNIVNEMTIRGQLKFIVSDYCLTYWDHVYVMYFNKQLAQNYQLENIYELVREGEWTIDKCIEMSRGKWEDNNSDDWPGQEDTFGYITDIRNTPDAMLSQFAINQSSRTEDGDVIIDYDIGKVTNVLTKMIDFKKTDDFYFTQSSSSDVAGDDPLDKIFVEGRALFYPAILRNAQVFRSMETDFGIIPYPKWDTNQDAYYTYSDVGFSVACIPVDAPNLEKSGAILDTLSAVSRETVIPAYYDEALSYKYTRDEDSVEMLDMIREGFTMDFTVFYAQTIGLGGILSNLLDYDNSNFASFYAANKKGYERKIKQLLEYYE